MSDWPPDLFLCHPRLPWSLDLRQMGQPRAAFESLAWENAFREMEALEEGAIANPDEGRQVGHYWLRDEMRAPTMGQARAIGETQEAIRALCEKIRAGALPAEDGLPFTDVLHIGIGGSALGPQLLIDALAEPGQGLSVHFLDNTDPDGIARVLGRLGDRLRHTLVVVVSKSGGTAETANAMHLVRHAVEGRGLQWASRAVAITGEDSALHRLARREGWLSTLPLWDWVGGRTSVTGPVGLVPGGLAGLDTAAFLDGAREMDAWTRTPAWDENPAALLAGSWYLAGNGRGDRAMVVLPYADRLLTLSRYLQQLIMESVGKRLDRQGQVVSQGLTVYGNKGSTDQHAFVQQLRDGRNDFFVLFLQVLSDGMGSDLPVKGQATAGDFLQGFLLGTRRALTEGERPSATLTVGQVDAHTLGGLIALFERAVGLYASLIDINAYHQPGVEAGKVAAAQILALSQKIRDSLGRVPLDVPTLAARLGADPLEVYYILERLVHTGRATAIDGPNRTYTAP